MLLIGAGAAEALQVPGPGTVVAVYRRAVYLRVPGGIIALVGPGVPPGPLWIRLESWPGDLPAGAPVTVGAGWLQVAGHHLSMAGGTVWRGQLPHPDPVVASRSLAEEVLAASPASALLSDPWRAVLPAVEAALGQGDLPGAARLLGGLGPGLTPAGDDALAGILLARRALDGEEAEAALVDAAGTARTSDLSAALLRWAARGQAVEPVHTFLAAVAEGDRAAAMRAGTAVASLGASSGADLLFGLRLGLRTTCAHGGRKP